MDYLTTSAFKLRSIVNTLWKNTCKSYNKHKNIEGADEKRETMVLKSIFQTDGQADRQTWLSSVIWKQSTNILFRFLFCYFYYFKKYEFNKWSCCCCVFVFIFKDHSNSVICFFVVLLYDFIRSEWATIFPQLNNRNKRYPRNLHTLTHIQKETSSTSHSSRDRAKKDTNISAIPWGACRHGTRSCGVHSRVFVSWCLSVLCCYWSA